jgi:uncharacterized membrane protein
MPRPAPRNLITLLFVFGFLIFLVQYGLVRIAFEKLGLSAHSAYLLLVSSLIGSMVNLPLFRLRVDPQPPAELPPDEPAFPGFPLWNLNNRVLIVMNVGGGLIPIAFCIYLIRFSEIALLPVLQSVFFVTLISYFASRPIKGLGIGMPILIAPFCAALIAMLLDPEMSAPLAYISGTLGVLIGADLLRLKDIRKMNSPIAAIGGAGTFDGVFITGIVAVLLA